jgi:hypothetical protein
MFYVPILFSSLGTGQKGALLNAVIIGGVNLVATFVSIYLVDRAGRRKLFLEGGMQMLIAQIAVGILLGVSFSTYNTSNLPDSITIVTLVLICIFVAGFAWSWGPLGWLVSAGRCCLDGASRTHCRCWMLCSLFAARPAVVMLIVRHIGTSPEPPSCSSFLSFISGAL